MTADPTGLNRPRTPKAPELPKIDGITSNAGQVSFDSGVPKELANALVTRQPIYIDAFDVVIRGSSSSSSSNSSSSSSSNSSASNTASNTSSETSSNTSSETSSNTSSTSSSNSNSEVSNTASAPSADTPASSTTPSSPAPSSASTPSSHSESSPNTSSVSHTSGATTSGTDYCSTPDPDSHVESPSSTSNTPAPSSTDTTTSTSSTDTCMTVPGSGAVSPTHEACQAADALKADLKKWMDQFDLDTINQLNNSGTQITRMDYLYKEINGWTVVNKNGGWFVTADDGRWGGPSKVGANVNSDAAGSQMRFSQLRAASPEHFSDWDQPQMESFYGYNSTRSDAVFGNAELLISKNNIFWHNASGTRSFLQKMMEKLKTAQDTIEVLNSLGDSYSDPEIADCASELQSMVNYLMDVGKGLFIMSDNQPTPYIIDFNGDGIATDDKMVNVGDTTMSWVKANAHTDDAVLVYDRNGDGQVAGLTELIAARSEDAIDGQASLGELDTNGDGLVDAQDAAFASMMLWFDRNGDGAVDAGELASLASRGVQSFGTAYVTNSDLATGTGFRTDANGNTHRYSTTVNAIGGAAYTMTDVFFNSGN